MNEGLNIYLDFEKLGTEDPEDIINRIDDILLKYRVKYSGCANIYVPCAKKTRDRDIYRAIEALYAQEWLRPGIVAVPVMSQTDVCRLSDINTERMSPPRQARYNYYLKYYKETGRLAHSIVVDENRLLRDGYISYLLAKEYGIRDVIIEEALKEQPIFKTVIGRHVDAAQNPTCRKRYQWIYKKREPVVPGDILLANTRYGCARIRVDRIIMNTGNCWTQGKKQVKMNMSCQKKQRAS